RSTRQAGRYACHKWRHSCHRCRDHAQALAVVGGRRLAIARGLSIEVHRKALLAGPSSCNTGGAIEADAVLLVDRGVRRGMDVGLMSILVTPWSLQPSESRLVVHEGKVPDVGRDEKLGEGRGGTCDDAIGHYCHPVDFSLMLAHEANMCRETRKAVPTRERFAVHQYAVKAGVGCEIVVDESTKTGKIVAAQGRRGRQH